MKKAFLKMLVLTLALTMLVGSSALAVQLTPFADEPVTLTVATQVDSAFALPENSWVWTFFEKELNLQFEVEQVTDSANYNQLTFASGNMPDLYIAMNLTSMDVMNYGVAEGQLVALDEYIDNGSMPNLAKVYEQYPEARAKVTCPDGHIYSLGIIRDDDLVDERTYWNVAMLEELGLQAPTTLDEFIDVLYAVKERYGENTYPMLGGYESYNPMGILLNAFGYLTRDSKGLSIAMRNGTPVFPYGDREAFGDFLTLMNQFYKDGIISPDFFTMDNTTYKAQALENDTFIIPLAPYVIFAETFDNYDAIEPLTSKYSDTRAWPSGTSIVSCGNVAISTNCKNLDAALFFVDWMYDAENYVMTAYGPQASDADLLYGMTSGWTMDSEHYGYTYADMADKGFDNNWDYWRGVIFGWYEGQFGYDLKIETSQAMAGYEPVGRVYNHDDGDDNYRETVIEHLQQYASAGYPTVAFFTAEETEGITDLKSVLESYAVPEIAKFITGSRSLDELDAYFDELDNLGYQEYVGYYVDYYNNNVAK